MKNKSLIIRLLLISSLIVPLSCTPISDHNLKKEFLNPPAKYRMNQNIHEIPLDENGQDSLIYEYLNQGYGGFAINVPYSEYLTEKGMKGFSRFCEKAHTQNMELWLYDENGYPSGNAGDLVINTNPAWEAMGLFFDDTLVSQGPLHFELPPGKPELIAAIPVADHTPLFDKQINLTVYGKNGIVNWDVPEGQWKVFAVTKNPLYEGFQVSKKPGGTSSPRYPSLMIPEVTQTFLKVNHEVYARYLGDKLGKYFTSTFTDEPSLMAVPFEWYSWSVIPWQEILSLEIEKRYGYRPEEKLAELFLDEGNEGQKIRYQYFLTVSNLISVNFFRTIKEWCEKHNLKSGGHLLLEETMMAHVPLYGDIMKCYREMHAPGIDILSCYPKFMPVHSPKLANSAKELTGNTLVMSEPCPIMERFTLGDEPPTETVRGHLNMLLAGGVTDFNNYLKLTHANRKEKVQINDYVARINLLLRGGTTNSDIAVLYPVESLWTQFIPEPLKVVDGFFTDPEVSGWDTLAGGNKEAVQIEQSFRNTARYLFADCREYSFIDSKALMEASVKNKSLVHGKLKWKILILPSVTTLPEKAWNKISTFIQNGGITIALEKMAENTSESFPDEKISSQIKNLFNSCSNAVFIPETESTLLRNQLNKFHQRPFILKNETLPIRAACKIINGKKVFFIYNDSEKEIHTKITFRNQKKMEEWDPGDGTIQEVNHEFLLELKPYHGKIYKSR